jgi:hypothetical protein
MDCQVSTSGCRGRVAIWRLWREGEAQTTAVAVCASHSRPLVQLERAGQPEPLPARPRTELKVTELKPTAATKPLKTKQPPEPKP